MATNTMVALLQSYAVTGSPVASIVIGSGNTIPQGYTDLFLVINGQGSAVSGGNLCVRLNADTNTYTSATRILGDGSAASSSRNTTGQSSGVMMGDVANADRFMAEINFQNYSNTTTYKTLLGRYSGQTYLGGYVGLWAQTAAITQITLLINGGQNFNVGTTVNLYGIKAQGDTGSKATGGVLYSDATYNYHVFTNSGNFTPSTALTADILTIAGGGGAGNANGGGGGGAGGIVYSASQSLASGTMYTCLVGSGGRGGSGTSTVAGLQGSNSSFIGGALSLTASVGGGIGANNGTNGGTGGSGGGAGASGGTPSSTTGGSPTSGQGYAGGNSSVQNGYYPNSAGGGGGGGAGAVGGNTDGQLGKPGYGGVGSSSYSSWGLATSTGQNVSGTVYYAGGGGGGWDYRQGTFDSFAVGGYGGGANGTSTQTANNGTMSTGGGGSGTGYANAGSTYTGGNGGSGIIIVRYVK